MQSVRYFSVGIGREYVLSEANAPPRGTSWPRAEAALPHLRSELRAAIEAAYADLVSVWCLLIGLLPRGPEEARGACEGERPPVPGVPRPVEQTITECLELIGGMSMVLTDYVPGVVTEPEELLAGSIPELEWLIGILDLFSECPSVSPQYRRRLSKTLESGLRAWATTYLARTDEILAQLGAS